jgi:hypothetical protein
VPLDSDRDGIDDAYQLQTSGPRPLNGLDASQWDPNGSSGLSYCRRYQQLRATAVQVIQTSPENGESGVAVTRESILTFREPLAAEKVLSTDQLYASFAGRKILGRVELSSDRRNATRFYLENRPGAARVRITLNPAGILDELGRELDGNWDGQPRGLGTFDFDTLSVTPVGVTAVVGHVEASDPVASARGGFTNRPLAGVLVTVNGAEEALRTTKLADGSFQLQSATART